MLLKLLHANFLRVTVLPALVVVAGFVAFGPVLVVDVVVVVVMVVVSVVDSSPPPVIKLLKVVVLVSGELEILPSVELLEDF